MSAFKDEHGWHLETATDSTILLIFDFAVSLRRGDGLLIRIEEPLVLRTPGCSDVLIDPEGDVNALAPLLRLIRDELTGGLARSDGVLELTFSSGDSITVDSCSAYEAWQISAPDGLLLVSLPGGGLAEWGPTVAQTHPASDTDVFPSGGSPRLRRTGSGSPI